MDSNDYPKYLLSATNLLFNSPVNTFLNQGRMTNTYSIQDNATWMKGKHEVSFGFQSQLLRTNPFNDGGIVPTYTLGISSANTTGLTAADLPGIRSSDLTTANNLYANLAGIVSTAAQTFNVTSTTSGFVPGATNLRQLTQSTWAGYAAGQVAGAAQPHAEHRCALRVLDADRRDAIRSTWRRACRTTMCARR